MGNIKFETCLTIQEAMEKSKAGDVLQWDDWPKEKVLDNEHAERMFAHIITCEYIGNRWSVIQKH